MVEKEDSSMQSESVVVEHIRVISQISALIRSEEHLDNKFAQALALIRKAVPFDSASLFLLNATENRLEEAATLGSRVELIESTPFEMGSGLSAWVAKQRDPVVLPDVRRNREDGFRSFVSVPLLSGDTLAGVLNLGHHEPHYFTSDHVQLLDLIASELALLIDRLHFEQELLEKNRQLEQARQEIEKQHRQLVEMEKFRLLGQVVASINHEINNPLTAILGNIDLMLLKYGDLDPALATQLHVIRDEAWRIGAIIEKLRDAKRVVVKEYLTATGETMLDIEHSS
jgi:GAF domain-containing protein